MRFARSKMPRNWENAHRCRAMHKTEYLIWLDWLFHCNTSWAKGCGSRFGILKFYLIIIFFSGLSKRWYSSGWTIIFRSSRNWWNQEFIKVEYYFFNRLLKDFQGQKFDFDKYIIFRDTSLLNFTFTNYHK